MKSITDPMSAGNFPRRARDIAAWSRPESARGPFQSAKSRLGGWRTPCPCNRARQRRDSSDNPLHRADAGGNAHSHFSVDWKVWCFADSRSGSTRVRQLAAVHAFRQRGSAASRLRVRIGSRRCNGLRLPWPAGARQRTICGRVGSPGPAIPFDRFAHLTPFCASRHGHP